MSGTDPTSPFPPVADYAFLSDCHTGALISPDGSVEWLCTPRFDAPSVFGSVLDRQAGYFRLGPFGFDHPATHAYVPGTNILETTWRTPTGWILVRDALVMKRGSGPDTVNPHTRPQADSDAAHVLVRTVECLAGHVEVELICEPAFHYGRTPATWALDAGGHEATARDRAPVRPAAPTAGQPTADDQDRPTAAGGTLADPERQQLRLSTDLTLGVEGPQVRARHVMEAGERAYCALSWSADLSTPATAAQAFAAVDTTIGFWRSWLDAARVHDHRYREPLERSALAIKGLTYLPTGATIAALTTSLPETPGGIRNWDYRYTWMRDTTFTLRALHSLDLDWEAEDFMQFVADLDVSDDGSLQVMYGIDGRRDLTERTLDHLTGYAGARPVRVGNDAFGQQQNDLYGAILDSILLQSRRTGRIPTRLWPVVESQAERARSVWHEPDQGIWEARGEPRHYVSSKIMCWVALDRAASLAAIRGDEDRKAVWRAAADEIHADVLAHGVRPDGSLRQHYDSDTLDASALLASIFGFLPGQDPCLRATVQTIARELTVDGFVLRYHPEETDDGLHGREGTFLICSFWLVSALAVVGEHAAATDLMDRLLRIASPLGLYAEEFDTANGRHLGNFPQAFSHLALIEAAGRIMAAEEAAQY